MQPGFLSLKLFAVVGLLTWLNWSRPDEVWLQPDSHPQIARLSIYEHVDGGLTYAICACATFHLFHRMQELPADTVYWVLY